MAEKTGYPVDMLDLDLDLEADLGIDTVKQAEVMATFAKPTALSATTPSNYETSPRSLASFSSCTTGAPSFVLRNPRPHRKRNAVPPAVAQAEHEVKAAPPAPAAIATKDTDAVKERILALMVEKTGYPQDMLDLDLDLEADLGVDTVKQAEMFAAIREIYSIPRDENRKLRDYPTLAHVIRFVYEKRPDLAAAKPAPPIAVKEAPTVKAMPPAPAPIATKDTDAVKERILA